MTEDICLICSSDKDENSLVICSECNEPDLPCCGACGQFFPKNEADSDGFHSADYCEEARFSCGICGEIFENKEVVETKWGNGFTEFTCLPCFEKEIK